MVGRFINADNLVTTGNDFTGMNLFAYCSNNPVKLQDSDGHLGFLTACLIIGVVGLVADVISGGARERTNAMLSDPTPYNVVNWATAGFADTVKGAVAPEEPLPVQHWMDSVEVVATVVGTAQAVKSIGEVIKPVAKGVSKVTQSIKYPGNNPAKCKIKGFEWRGNGDPISGKGNYVNIKTGEWLHPDLNHGPPLGPHWDYGIRGSSQTFRIFPDGSILPK